MNQYCTLTIRNGTIVVPLMYRNPSSPRSTWARCGINEMT